MTPLRQYSLVALLTCGIIPALAQPSSQGASLQPDWTYSLAPGIEWAAAVGRGTASAVLLATPAGQLHLLDLDTGQPRLAAPIPAGRGVRPAEEPGAADVAYCFDRHAAYALRLSEPAGLKWQFGQTLGADEKFQGEPEKLAGWAHARVTPAGLLLVNVDGRIVLLSPADGQPRWELQLDRMPLSRLHVWETNAAVLWKSGGAVRAAFLALDETPKPVCRELGDTWPVWSDLVPEGLLTVSPQEATLRPSDGPRRVMPLDISDLTAQAVAAWPSASGTRLLVGDGPRVHALDVAAGQVRWRERGARFSGFKVLALAIHDDRVVVTSELGVSVRDAATGRLLAECFLLPTIQIAAWWVSGLEILYVASGPGSASRLDRVELPLPAATTAPAPAPSARYDLPPASEIRQVLWSGQHMVLVEANALTAYTLP
jgi:outer membrane protein assembly factor BamB